MTMTAPPDEYALVGKRVRPDSAVAKGTGATQFTPDINLPGMLWIKIVRSPHAHARIVRIATSEAASVPGVETILTYQNIPDRVWGAEGERMFSEIVSFVGHAVAAIAAPDLDTLEVPASKIRVEYEI